jgi:hypothetical protein
MLALWSKIYLPSLHLIGSHTHTYSRSQGTTNSVKRAAHELMKIKQLLLVYKFVYPQNTNYLIWYNIFWMTMWWMSSALIRRGDDISVTVFLGDFHGAHSFRKANSGSVSGEVCFWMEPAGLVHCPKHSTSGSLPGIVLVESTPLNIVL